MSANNGDKARHQKQRKRKLQQRVKIRTMVADAKAAKPVPATSNEQRATSSE
jgi:hypothetical protein